MVGLWIVMVIVMWGWPIDFAVAVWLLALVAHLVVLRYRYSVSRSSLSRIWGISGWFSFICGLGVFRVVRWLLGRLGLLCGFV